MLSRAEQFLYRLSRGKSGGLARMRALMEALESPHEKLPIIHVAGTNGKGSVCAYLEEIYRSAGYRVGLFTSPHLVTLAERFQINRQPIENQVLGKYIDEVNRAIKKHALGSYSFFEFITAIAFLYFYREKIDLGIFEVGLGGRLDATNILTKPLISVITSIGFDHMEVLGHTLKDIAREKAGIIKGSVPVVLGRLPAEAKTVIESVAEGLKAKVIRLNDRFTTDTLPIPSLEGEHQRINAGTATLVCEQLTSQFPTTPEQVKNALKHTHWAGRWQRFSDTRKNEWVMDNTHNIEGVPFLEKNIDQWSHYSPKPLIAVVGFTGQKRAEAILPAVVSRVSKIYIYPLDANNHGVNVEEILSIIKNSKSQPPIETLTKGLKCLIELQGKISSKRVLVVGSTYLVGDALNALTLETNCLKEIF